MSTASELHTARVAEAFDAVAEKFETALENDVTRSVRQQVYARIASLVPAGSTVIDINCGIGIDAVELTKMGYLVSGADISPQMVQQARLRAAKQPIQNIEFRNTSFENLAPFYGKTFDLALSNFGGLNCVPSLQAVAQHLMIVTEPGGYFLAVVMPPFSLWEFFAGIFKLNFRFAFRRLWKNVRATGFGKSTFAVNYFSPRAFAQQFRHTFEVVDVRGINIISPPPHATTFVKRFPKLTKWLERMEQSIASLPLLRTVGDHYMIVMRRKQFSKHPGGGVLKIVLTPPSVQHEMEGMRRNAKGLDDNPNFTRLLSGKRVAVVGPARTLVGKKLGALIDSYDIVVRLNEAFEYTGSSRQLTQDIGERTDILYTTQGVIRQHILAHWKLPQNIFFANKHNLQQFLVCTNNSLDYSSTGEPVPKCPRHDKHVLSNLQKHMKQNGWSIDFRLVYGAGEFLIRCLRGHFPRTGLVAIADLLSFDIDQLFITGMTFYHGGGHLLFKETVELHPLKNPDGSWAHDGSGFGHNSYAELHLMSILMQAFPNKLSVDDDLMKLLLTNGMTTLS